MLDLRTPHELQVRDGSVVVGRTARELLRIFPTGEEELVVKAKGQIEDHPVHMIMGKAELQAGLPAREDTPVRGGLRHPGLFVRKSTQIVHEAKLAHREDPTAINICSRMLVEDRAVDHKLV